MIRHKCLSRRATASSPFETPPSAAPQDEDGSCIPNPLMLRRPKAVSKHEEAQSAASSMKASKSGALFPARVAREKPFITWRQKSVSEL